MVTTPEGKKYIKSIWIKILVNFLFLCGSFLTVHYLKKQNFIFDSHELKFFPLFFFCWIISGLISVKFRDTRSETYHKTLKPFVINFVLFVGLLSLSLSLFGLLDLSRFIVFGSIGICFLLEVLFLSDLYYSIVHLENKPKEKKAKNSSSLFFLHELLFISILFVVLHAHYMNGSIVNDDHLLILSTIYFLWLYNGIASHHFNVPVDKSYFQALRPFLRAILIASCVVFFCVFVYKIIDLPRYIIFGSIGALSAFELFFVSVIYIYKKPMETDETSINIFKAPIYEKPKEDIIDYIIDEGKGKIEKYQMPGSEIQSTFIFRKLKHVYLKRFPHVFDFIDKHVALNTFDILNSIVYDTQTLYNIEILPHNELDFFLNIHELNSFRRLNRYLIEVNHKLKKGGILLGRFQPKERRQMFFYEKYPHFIANIVYFFDFIWKRMFPKLPFFKKIYFAFSKGQNRVLSMAEGLGRIYYCGFEVLAMEEIGSYIFFIAKKTKAPALDLKPSYNLLFKMKRVGKHGKPIYVYKFRTMHPYSEFLQDFVLKKFGYANSGKPANDFRVTSWGKFLRRLWLDELPQILNVLKGDMKLVGIRPISQRFLDEFPEDIKQLRMKYKPGCLPAYVALLKQSKDGFIEAETTYLLEKEKHPFLTDIKYIYKAVYNILTNKIRSE